MSEEAHNKKTILVEVAYATPEKQLIIPLQVPVGTTAYEAVVQSEIVGEFDGIDIENDAMGIFSRVLNGKALPTPKEYVLSEKDRVEIYRPLTIDPKQARLKRAEEKKARKAEDAQE
jgi:uncharacterized protein